MTTRLFFRIAFAFLLARTAVAAGADGGGAAPGSSGGWRTAGAPLSSANPDASVATTTAADPVDLASGSLVDSATDLSLPGLAWKRAYDSRARFSAGDLGRGWTHPFEARVSFGTDPEAAFGGVNLYAYAAGDPLSYIDPLGLCPFFVTNTVFPVR